MRLPSGEHHAQRSLSQCDLIHVSLPSRLSNARVLEPVSPFPLVSVVLGLGLGLSMQWVLFLVQVEVVLAEKFSPLSN